MGLIPDDVIGEIRQRADIVAVIGQHVQLRKAGRNHKGLCPFHGEKTPSFNVNPDKGFFYCFGCQKKGDVFTFVMEYEGKSFMEAAEQLARLAGVTLPEPEAMDPAQRRAIAEQRSEKAQLYRINQLAAEFFRRRLLDAGGLPAREYLTERGVSDEIAARFQLGYAPDEWGALADFLAQEKVPARQAETLGLIAPRQRASGHYDRFRHRLVCPVIQASGEIVGFSARALPGAVVTAPSDGGDAPAKYINSPESPIYKKSKLLYGVQQARDAIRIKGRVVLVEGNFDVISLHQAGVTETMAPLGTALTEDQVDLLRRLSDKVVLVYDGDKAGRAATLKALRLLIAAGLDVFIVELPMGEDPDSVARKGGALAALFDKTRPAIGYFISHVWGTPGQSAVEYSRAVHEAASVLPAVKDELGRRHIIDQFAGQLGVPFERLRADLRAAFRGQEVAQPVATAQDRKEQQPLPPTDEMDLLSFLAEFPDLASVAEQLDVLSLLTDSRLRDMYSAALGGGPLWSSPHADTSPEIAAHVLSGAKKSVAHPELALREAISNLKTRRDKQLRQKLLHQLQQAERRQDDELVRELTSRARDIRQPKEE
jgi:DNA primase